MIGEIIAEHRKCSPESGGQRDREAGSNIRRRRVVPERASMKAGGFGTTPALRATPPDSGGELLSPSVHAACLLLFLLLTGCANAEYRFERFESGKTVPIPMKFDSLYGARDGESVTAEARFSNGNDSAQMNVRLFLRPPAEFVSGTYRLTIDGKTVEGIVECQSLDYQGGQGSVPSMGGKFVLKPGYRIILPSTPIKRR